MPLRAHTNNRLAVEAQDWLLRDRILLLILCIMHSQEQTAAGGQAARALRTLLGEIPTRED
jgi:hypothetical protein